MSVHIFYHLMSGHIIPPSLQDVLLSIAYNKQHHIAQLKTTVDKYRSLCGLYLLKTGLEKLDLPRNAWSSIRFESQRKPIADYPVDFSISHTNKLILCAISLSTKVGADAEYLEPENGRKQHRNKLQAIRDWTCKEAVIKAHGQSSAVDINRVQLAHNRGRFKGNLWYIHAINLHPDYILHLATHDKNVSFHLHNIPIDDLRS